MGEMNSIGSGLSRLLMHFVWRLRRHDCEVNVINGKGGEIHFVLLTPSFFKN